MKNQKNEKNLLGRFKDGKMVYTTPRYNFLRGGNWNSGFSGVGSTGGNEISYEILNEEKLDKLKPFKSYHFDVIDGKALITE